MHMRVLLSRRNVKCPTNNSNSPLTLGIIEAERETPVVALLFSTDRIKCHGIILYSFYYTTPDA